MSDDDSGIYCAEREQPKRNLAWAALDPTVAAIHLELARRYAQLVEIGERAVHA